MYVDPKLYAAEELANAIIIKAVEDYRKAMKDLWLCPRSINARHTIVECESFFRSPYFNLKLSIKQVIESQKVSKKLAFCDNLCYNNITWYVILLW